MSFDRQIAQMLHDEHLQTVSLLERFEALLRGHRKGPPPDPASDREFAQVARELKSLADSDVGIHFAFEEEQLFPRLAEFGDGAMGELLAEEHRTLLPMAARLSELCGSGLQGALAEEDWAEFKRLGADFIETMTGHIQKEEMGLLFALESMLDESADQELAMAYASAR